MNGAKGVSALQVSRDLDVQYKTAFVLSHKLREAMAADHRDGTLSGTVEVDGAYFGGYVRPANHKEHRRDRRLLANQSGKRQSVIIMRERAGRSLAFVTRTEALGTPLVAAHVAPGSMVNADEASHWDSLHARYDTARINHSHCYSDGLACTNQAESFFSRLRRAEIGVHHHVAGPYLNAYATEMTWREDNRRVPNGTLATMVASAALTSQVSRTWKGYWQRRAA